MKKLMLSSLIIFLSNFNFSQTEEFSCVIDRSNYNVFQIISESDTFFLGRDLKENRVLNKPNISYKFEYGKGRKRDKNGIKERHKSYVVGTNSDTILATWNSFTSFQLDDSTIVDRIWTAYGWEYVDRDSTIIAEIDFNWNESNWNYYFTFFEVSERVENLKKGIMLSLVEMAAKRSKCKCDNGDDDTLFIILWATSLVSSVCK